MSSLFLSVCPKPLLWRCPVPGLEQGLALSLIIMMEKIICPTEIWHKIFALACTDTGITGQSLSLVSKHFHIISQLFKYQSITITQWRQLIAFAQTFSQLLDDQKRIKYLYIQCPYPFLHVEDNPRLLNERSCSENWPRDASLDGGDCYSEEEDSDSDSDCLASESDSDLDSDLESDLDGSVTSDEKREIFEDAKYLRAVGKDSLPVEGSTRDDNSNILDDNIQAVFDQTIQALHAILNETSSTLNILTLYWTSFRPLPIHHILPPLPFLDELHLFRCCIVAEDVYDDGSTTTLFPRLRLLFISGDRYNRSLSRSIATIAPNLTHLRFTRITSKWEIPIYLCRF